MILSIHEEKCWRAQATKNSRWIGMDGNKWK
jgi:hypothetical protein